MWEPGSTIAGLPSGGGKGGTALPFHAFHGRGISMVHWGESWKSSGTGSGRALTMEKSSGSCSCASGCCSRHSTRSSSGQSAQRLTVRVTLAWHRKQSVIIRCSSERPGTRWCTAKERLRPPGASHTRQRRPSRSSTTSRRPPKCSPSCRLIA